MSRARRKQPTGGLGASDGDEVETQEKETARPSYTRNPKFLMQPHMSYTADADPTKLVRNRAGSAASVEAKGIGSPDMSQSFVHRASDAGMSTETAPGQNGPGMRTGLRRRRNRDKKIDAFQGLAGIKYRLRYIGQTCLFNPAGFFILVWSYCITLCIMITVIEGPIVAAFRVQTKGVNVVLIVVDIIFMIDMAINIFKGYVASNRMIVMDQFTVVVGPIVAAYKISNFWVTALLIVVDSMFFFDIIINFLTGYVASNRAVIMDQKRALRHYLSTWFIIDLAGALPWGIISIWVKEAMWIALLKLLRLFSMRHLLDHIQSLNANLLTWVRLGLIFVGWIALMNLLACIWFFIAKHSDGVYPHVSYYNDSAELFEDADFSTQYTYSYYYIVVTMVTVGYGDITPNTLNQIWFANVIMVVTGFFDAFIFGYVVMLVSTFYSDNVANIAKNKHILQYIENNNLPKQVERRIWHYTTHKDNLRHRFDVEHVFNGYPPHLLKEIKLYSHFDKVVRLLGTNIPVDVCLRLASRLQWTYCVIQEQWVEDGLFGDHAFYLMRGQMTVFHGDCCVRELTGPADLWYGSDMLFGPKKKHEVTVEATEDCDLFILTRHDLLELMEELPELRDKIKHNLIEMKMEIHELKHFEVNDLEMRDEMTEVDPYGNIIGRAENDVEELESAEIQKQYQPQGRNNQDTIVIPAPSTRQILGKMHPRVSVYTGSQTDPGRMYEMPSTIHEESSTSHNLELQTLTNDADGIQEQPISNDQSEDEAKNSTASKKSKFSHKLSKVWEQSTKFAKSPNVSPAPSPPRSRHNSDATRAHAASLDPDISYALGATSNISGDKIANSRPNSVGSAKPSRYKTSNVDINIATCTNKDLLDKMANIADKESVSNDEDATKEHSKSVPHRDTQQPQQPCSPGASKSDTRTHIDAYSDIYGGWKGGTDGGTDGGTSSPKSPQTHQKASPPMSPANPLSRPYTPPLPSSLSQKTTHRQLATTHIQSPLHTQASTNTQGNIGLQLGAEMGFGGVTDDSDDKVNMNRSESVGRFTVQSRSSSAKLKSPVQHEFYRTPSHLTKSADGMKNQELGVQWSFGEEDTRDMLLLPSGDVSSSNMSSSSTPQSPTEHYS